MSPSIFRFWEVFCQHNTALEVSEVLNSPTNNSVAARQFYIDFIRHLSRTKNPAACHHASAPGNSACDQQATATPKINTHQSICALTSAKQWALRDNYIATMTRSLPLWFWGCLAQLFVGAMMVLPNTAPAHPDFSAGKTPAQLFDSDCSGCHRSAQGLARGHDADVLTEFLREHYTTKTESATQLASYLIQAHPEQLGVSRHAVAAVREQGVRDLPTPSERITRNGDAGEGQQLRKPVSIGYALSNKVTHEPESRKPGLVNKSTFRAIENYFLRIVLRISMRFCYRVTW